MPSSISITRRILSCIPLIGVVTEFLYSPPYLSDSNHPARYYLSAAYQALSILLLILLPILL